MSRSPRIPVLAAVAAAALLLSACAGVEEDPQTPSGDGVYVGQFGGQALAIGDPVSGGEFTYGLSFAVPTLDPTHGLGGSTEFAMKLIYDRLMEIRPDGSVGPGVAESLTTEDNVLWTLSLPAGLTFTDGTPFGADAVIAHVERVAAEDSQSLHAADARRIVSTTAIDQQTVEFTLEAPNRQFDLLLAAGSLSMIPSPTAVAEKGDGFALAPVGAGPFLVESYAPDGEIVLARNPDYRVDGVPHLDRVRLIPVQDEQSRIAGVVSGDLDAASLSTLPQLTAAAAQGATTLEQPWYSGYYLTINNQDEVLADVRVRAALNAAIDRDTINQVLFDGLHYPMAGVLVPSHPYAEDTGRPLYDPERARTLLEEVAADSGEGIRLNLMINQMEQAAQIAALLQQMFAEVGVTLNYDVVDPTAQVGAIISGEYQLALHDRAIPAETTHTLRQYFGTGQQRNFSATSIPEFDALTLEVTSAASDAERIALIPDLLRVLTDEVVTGPIISGALGRIVGPRVLGFPDGDPNNNSTEIFDLRQVWVQQ